MDTRNPRRAGKVGGDKSPLVEQLPRACSDERLAVEFMEAQRWGDCPHCPHCGDTNVRKMMGKDGERSKRFLWRCGGCRKQFTVRIKSVYEDSRIPMRHWVFAFWSACTHKKGVSALQIKRQTGLNYRSALFMMNRIRHAMAPVNPPPLKGIVEADEVYIGGSKSTDNRRLYMDEKMMVMGAVERGGQVRTRPVEWITGRNIREFVKDQVSPDALFMTDGLASYVKAAPDHNRHRVVKHHKGEYVKARDPIVHTNTIEGFFSLLRRRLDGTHHAVSREHLHRYCTEAAFIYNHRKVDDGARTVAAIRAASGKRLTYEQAVMREAV